MDVAVAEESLLDMFLELLFLVEARLGPVWESNVGHTAVEQKICFPRGATQLQAAALGPSGAVEHSSLSHPL